MMPHPGHFAALAKNGGGPMQLIKPGFDAPPPRKCCYPLWGEERPTMVFCNGPIAKGSYCETHAAICYQRPTESPNRVVALQERRAVFVEDRDTRPKTPREPRERRPSFGARPTVLEGKRYEIRLEWCGTEIEREIVTCWLRKMNARQIALDRGCTTSTVLKTLQRIRRRRGKAHRGRHANLRQIAAGAAYERQHMDPAWAENEHDALLIQLFNANMPTGEIARRVGKNKNQVCGRLHRLRAFAARRQQKDQAA